MSIVFECFDSVYPEYIRLVTKLADTFTPTYGTSVILEPKSVSNHIAKKSNIIAACIVLHTEMDGDFDLMLKKFSNAVQDYSVHLEFYGNISVVTIKAFSSDNCFKVRVMSLTDMKQYQFMHYNHKLDNLAIPNHIMLRVQPGEKLTTNTLEMLIHYDNLRIKVEYNGKEPRFERGDVGRNYKINELKYMEFSNKYTVVAKKEINTSKSFNLGGTTVVDTPAAGVPLPVKVNGNKRIIGVQGPTGVNGTEGPKSVPFPVVTTVQSPLKRLLLLGYTLYANKSSSDFIKNECKTRVINTIISNGYFEIPIVEVDSELDKKVDDMEKEINVILEEVDKYSTNLLLLLCVKDIICDYNKQIGEHIYSVKEDMLKKCLDKYY